MGQTHLRPFWGMRSETPWSLLAACLGEEARLWPLALLVQAPHQAGPQLLFCTLGIQKYDSG